MTTSNTTSSSSTEPESSCPQQDHTTYPPTPANSLFIANLPLRLSNQDLAWSLQNAFRPFGPLRLIRASRDARGRPFGFVDFCREEDGEAALQAACNTKGSGVVVGGRVTRVERARFQARLIITPCLENNLDGPVDLTDGVTVRHYLDRTIVQFEERQVAISVYEHIKEKCPSAQLCWLLPGHHVANQQAIVRSSGLVQLAPDGSDLWSRQSTTNGTNSQYNNPNGGPRKSLATASHLQTFEEELLVDEPPHEHYDVYVGRLCSWRVTRDLLKERFGQYGQLISIRLFNRGVIRPDSPVDAFAHIGFATQESQLKSIREEDGQCWLGQVMTVQPLILSKAQRLQSAAKALSSASSFSEYDFEII